MKNNDQKLNKVIALVNQKGGVAKTTTSINLAYGLYSRGYDVLLVDGDPQSSSLDWATVREQSDIDLGFTVIGVPKTNLAKEVTKLKSKYDFIIVDSAGRQSELTRLAIVACDLAIVPNTTSPLDAWATKETLKSINEIKSYRDFSAYFLLSGVNPQTKVFNEVKEWLADSYPLPILDTRIALRTVYARSLGVGQSIFDYKDEKGQLNKKAVDEFNALIDEILINEGIV